MNNNIVDLTINFVINNFQPNEEIKKRLYGASSMEEIFKIITHICNYEDEFLIKFLMDNYDLLDKEFLKYLSKLHIDETFFLITAMDNNYDDFIHRQIAKSKIYDSFYLLAIYNERIDYLQKFFNEGLPIENIDMIIDAAIKESNSIIIIFMNMGYKINSKHMNLIIEIGNIELIKHLMPTNFNLDYEEIFYGRGINMDLIIKSFDFLLSNNEIYEESSINSIFRLGIRHGSFELLDLVRKYNQHVDLYLFLSDAIEIESANTIKWLINNGMDMSRDYSEELEHMYENGLTEMAELLLNNGAIGNFGLDSMPIVKLFMKFGYR